MCGNCEAMCCTGTSAFVSKDCIARTPLTKSKPSRTGRQSPCIPQTVSYLQYKITQLCIIA